MGKKDFDMVKLRNFDWAWHETDFLHPCETTFRYLFRLFIISHDIIMLHIVLQCERTPTVSISIYKNTPSSTTFKFPTHYSFLAKFTQRIHSVTYNFATHPSLITLQEQALAYFAPQSRHTRSAYKCNRSCSFSQKYSKAATVQENRKIAVAIPVVGGVATRPHAAAIKPMKR